MSNLFYSAFRPRFDVNLTLHALRRDLEIWSGTAVGDILVRVRKYT